MLTYHVNKHHALSTLQQNLETIHNSKTFTNILFLLIPTLPKSIKMLMLTLALLYM